MRLLVCHAQGTLSPTDIRYLPGSFFHLCFEIRALTESEACHRQHSLASRSPESSCLPFTDVFHCSQHLLSCWRWKSGSRAYMASTLCTPCRLTSWCVLKWTRCWERKVNECIDQPGNLHTCSWQRWPSRTFMELHGGKQSVLVFAGMCFVRLRPGGHLSTLGTPQKNLTVIDHLTRLLINPDFSLWQLGKQRQVLMGFVPILWYNQCKCTS